jgi:hypothetical protein
MFFHQSDQFVTNLHCDLQKIALLFGINCPEINQSQSSNIFMYIINGVILPLN